MGDSDGGALAFAMRIAVEMGECVVLMLVR